MRSGACSMERTGDLWDTGAIDITGSLMVVVLKQISVCHNLSDSYSSKQYSQERYDLRIPAAPNPLHYFSYLFASGNLLAGPFHEYLHYKHFMAREREWAKAFGAPLFKEAMRAAVRCFGIACGALAAEQLVSARFQAAMVLAPAAFKMPLWRRYLVAFATGARPLTPGQSADIHKTRARADTDRELRPGRISKAACRVCEARAVLLHLVALGGEHQRTGLWLQWLQGHRGQGAQV